MKTRLPSIYSHELADVIFSQPYCRIKNLVDAGIAKRQTASTHLKQMAAHKILEERQMGREKLFLNPRFMRLVLADTNEYPPFE